MPASLIAAMCAGTSRRASSPPWIFGCRVLTRPSSISGKPVYSATSVTAMPFSREQLGRAAGGEDGDLHLRQRAREFDHAGLVGNADEGLLDEDAHFQTWTMS